MFRTIAAAYNESPEAEHALLCAIRLAKSLGAKLSTITVAAELPASTAFAGAEGPLLSRVLANDREKFYEMLVEKAQASAQSHGVEVHVTSSRDAK